MARRCSECSAELDGPDDATVVAGPGAAVLCSRCAEGAAEEGVASASADGHVDEPEAGAADATPPDAEAPTRPRAPDTTADVAPGASSPDPGKAADPAAAGADARPEDDVRTGRALTKHKSPPRRPSVRDFGRYEILEEVSRGAMGIVYRARERRLGRVVALKVLLAGEHASEEQVGRFIREARAVARLRHPNIVPIHDVGEFEGLHYFTMDYIDGEPLSHLIARGEVDIRTSLDITEAVADAVECAHQAGVIHRDIKPSNIMIDSGGRPQITDFGLAKPVDSDTHYTRSGTTIGTPAYMPPEQARGDISAITSRSDVYSIGAVLYELVTGVTPFDGPNMLDIILDVIHDDPARPRRMNPRVHSDIETIILKAMEKDPERRYWCAAALRDDIRRFKAGEAIQARPPSVLRHMARLIGRYRVGIMAAVTVLAVLAGTTIIIRDIKRRGQRDDEPRTDPASARHEQPVWNTVWEDREPKTGKDGEWSERASVFEGREIYPVGRAPYNGNVKMTASVEIAEGTKNPEIAIGFFSNQDPQGQVPFYGVVGGGKVRIFGVADIERSAAARRTLRDVRVLIERAAPEPKPGARYHVLFERRDLDISFKIAGDGLDEELSFRNLHLSNWRAKNLQPVLGVRKGARWGGFRLDQLFASEQNAFDAADMFFIIGEYNGAATKFEAIVKSGRPEHRVDTARLRLGMCDEVKGRFQEALRWYGALADGAAGPGTAIEAKLRESLCYAALGRLDEAAASIEDLAGRAGGAERGAWDAPRSVWGWELARLAETFISAKRFPAAAEAVCLARPDRGWSRMESAAVAVAKGLAGEGRSEELFQLADACPGADLAPAFAAAVLKLAAASPEDGLMMLAASAERYPAEAGAFGKAGAAVAKAFIKQERFAQVVHVHRTWALDSSFAMLKDALAAAASAKSYSQARALLAYAHSVKPEHDDVLRGLSVALAKQLCADGRFDEVRWVYNAYPDPALIVSFREAAQGLSDRGDPNRTVSLLEFALRNLGGGDGKLAGIAAAVSRRFVEAGTVEQSLRLFVSVEAYPGRAHAPHVARAMRILAAGGRPQAAVRLFAALRAHLGEGDPGLASLGLAVLESVGEPEEREKVFASLDDVAQEFEGNAPAQARWLVELGDIACRVGGRPKRAEECYDRAIVAGSRDPAGRAEAAIASARRAALLETERRRAEADVVWNSLAGRADLAGGLAGAAALMAGRKPAGDFASWLAAHGAEMSEAEGAVYLGLRALRDDRAEEAADAILRARESTTGRRWPYHILRRLEDMLSRGNS
ncbi:MAG: protein kinase domain-containing protein [Planctomycetota bacterium]